MQLIGSLFSDAFRDRSSLMLALLVFLAAGTLAFTLMATLRVRGEVKRRTSRIVMDESERAANSKRSLRYSSVQAVARLIEYTTKHYGFGQRREHEDAAPAADPGRHLRSARRRLLLYRPHRARRRRRAGAAGRSLPMLTSKGGSFFWLVIIVGGIAGYVAPAVYVDKRISVRRVQHRMGFPDFMDLLVVCADSGLSMEASLERIGREMGESYPSLTANIHMTNLEIRAGRPLKDALERFADRLGLEEARQFATLINQSLDLGSSINDALRVYSDDMRHKRLSLAEEKAYALPAKLSLPMMICIFPVLFVVILLPVFIRLHTGNY